MTWTLEETDDTITGTCPCCGNNSRIVWGEVHDEEGCFAIYHVHWTISHIMERGAYFDIILIERDEETSEEYRHLTSLDYRVIEGKGNVMVIDAAQRPLASQPEAGCALRRDDIIGTPSAKFIFTIFDLIYLMDGRLEEFRSTQAANDASSPPHP